ncbi:MAG: PH domain-containing protein [Acidobacteriota bacterium]
MNDELVERLTHSRIEQGMAVALCAGLTACLFAPLSFELQMFGWIALAIVGIATVEAFRFEMLATEDHLRIRGAWKRTREIGYDRIHSISFDPATRLEIRLDDGKLISVPSRMPKMRSFLATLGARAQRSHRPSDRGVIFLGEAEKFVDS